jgi:predicted transcriptional regulator
MINGTAGSVDDLPSRYYTPTKIDVIYVDEPPIGLVGLEYWLNCTLSPIGELFQSPYWQTYLGYSELQNWISYYLNGSISGTPQEAGTFYVRLDYASNILFDRVNLTIIVIDPYHNITMNEDTLSMDIDLNEWFHYLDPENEHIIYGSPASDNIDVYILLSGNLTVFPKEDWAGQETVEIYAFTNEGKEMDDIVHILNVTVREVNDPPENPWINLGNYTCFEGEAVAAAGNANDPDIPYGDRLTQSWESDISGPLGTGDLVVLNLPEGLHNITLTVTDLSGANCSAWVLLKVMPNSTAGMDDDDGYGGLEDTQVIAIVAVASGAVIIGIWFFVLTEIGIWLLFTWILLPLYTRLKKEDVLNQESRGIIYGYIIANPGVHYFEMLNDLKLSNGTLIYHLGVLERRGFIKILRSGTKKLFFPKEYKGVKYTQLTKNQMKILKTVRFNEESTQSVIAKRSGLSQPTVSRNLKELANEGLIQSSKETGKIRYKLYDSREELMKD